MRNKQKKIIMPLTERPEPIQLEPKRDNRFLVTFPEDFDIEPWAVTSISRPSIKIDKWQNISIIFVDPVRPSTSKRLMNLINKYKKKKKSWNPFSKKKDIFTFTLEALDPTGVTVEIWSIDVEGIESIDFGNYDYSKDGIQKIKMVLKPSKCELTYTYMEE